MFRRTFITTYANVVPDITREAVAYHVGGDWLKRKKREYGMVVQWGKEPLRIARSDGVLAGFGRVAASRRNGALFVAPEYHGSRVGLALLYALACDVGVKEDTHLMVVPGTPAVKFYSRLGFVRTYKELPVNFPRLRGGQILPLMELVLYAETAQQTMERVAPLLAEVAIQ